MKQVSVITNNEPGVLNGICEALGGAGINIDSLVAEGWGEVGMIRLITTDPESAKKVLEQRSFKVSVSDVFTILIPDQAGGARESHEKAPRRGHQYRLLVRTQQGRQEDRDSARN